MTESNLPPRIGRLRAALAGALPGRRAHERLWVHGDPTRRLDVFEPDMRPAAVLLAFFLDPERDRFVVPLIRRPDSMEHHAGQIGLPGGAVEPGETPLSTALREAEEEIGLSRDRVRVLGQLTAIPVQVSRYRIDPFVAWVEGAPQFAPDAREVEGMLLADLDALAAAGPTRLVRRVRMGLTLEVPAYDVSGHAVWGATGFILAELAAIWAEL